MWPRPSVAQERACEMFSSCPVVLFYALAHGDTSLTWLGLALCERADWGGCGLGELQQTL